MMFALILNVLDNVGQVRFTNSKWAITILPGELAQSREGFVHPFGVTFQKLSNLTRCQYSRSHHQRVNVIFDACPWPLKDQAKINRGYAAAAFSPRALSPFQFQEGIFSCSVVPTWAASETPFNSSMASLFATYAGCARESFAARKGSERRRAPGRECLVH